MSAAERFRVRAGRPLVTVKLAVSLDGRIATRTGDSQWISGPESRAQVHRMRRDSDAVLVGGGTLRVDDPQLTTRIDGEPDARTPHRFVLDTRLRAPSTSRVFDVEAAPTTVFCSTAAPEGRREALEVIGVEVVPVQTTATGLDLREILSVLGSRGISSLLVEGGGELVGALVDDRLADRLVLFVAPVVIGGGAALPGVGGSGAAHMSEALRATSLSVARFGADVCLTADLNPMLSPEPGEVGAG